MQDALVFPEHHLYHDDQQRVRAFLILMPTAMSATIALRWQPCFLYLHVFLNKHGLVAVGACAVKLNDISVIAHRFEDLYLLHVAQHISQRASNGPHTIC